MAENYLKGTGAGTAGMTPGERLIVKIAVAHAILLVAFNVWFLAKNAQQMQKKTDGIEQIKSAPAKKAKETEGVKRIMEYPLEMSVSQKSDNAKKGMAFPNRKAQTGAVLPTGRIAAKQA